MKSKSLTTEETSLNEALARRGITAVETDLAQLIVQLSGDAPSHIVVPAIHRNREEIRCIFLGALDDVPADLPDEPRALAEAARAHLRKRFLAARVGISGVNFAVAETGTIVLVESEGNARMVSTLPEVLISVMGIEKVIPRWEDLEVYLQLLARSATAERMSPYTSMWAGVPSSTPADGPSEFHLVLLDNGRTEVLAQRVGRAALSCIRCAACLNVCPVYERTGGHAYGSTYPGPIGAIITPMLSGMAQGRSLPYASSLCGACYEVCPVKIDIPKVLLDLRRQEVESRASSRGLLQRPSAEAIAMRSIARVFADRRLYEAAQRVGRLSRWLTRGERISHLPRPLSSWTDSRDLPVPPSQTFREWWRERA